MRLESCSLFFGAVIFQVYVKVQWFYSGKDVGNVVKSLYVFRFILFLHLTPFNSSYLAMPTPSRRTTNAFSRTTLILSSRSRSTVNRLFAMRWF